MVHISVIEARLSQLGVHLSRWFQAELKELQHVLLEHEKIIAAVPGRYFGGYALLVATDQRLLLIDKRTFMLTLEDIRYDMISQTNYSSHLMDAVIEIFTLNKQHRFTTVKYKSQLRTLTDYVQRRVMELRQPTPQLAQPQSQDYYPKQDLYTYQEPKHHHAFLRGVVSHRTTKLVGAAAITGVNRIPINNFRPMFTHVASNYTGPALLSGMFIRR